MHTEKSMLSATTDTDKFADGKLADSKFVFCSSNRAHFDWLDRVLNEWHLKQQEMAPLDMLVARMTACKPKLLLLDFSGNCGEEDIDCNASMIGLAQRLKAVLPDLQMVAVGTMDYPDGAIAALRAGVHHFVDMHADAEEARNVIRKLIVPDAAAIPESCTLIALAGARIGIGTTTLAVHLADLLQQRRTLQQTEPRIGLLDLGLPVGDGQLYLNAAGAFHLDEAIRNRHRLDQTLIQTALPRTASGVRIVSLPRTSNEIAGIAASDTVALLTQLCPYFDVLIVDLGGFPHAGFISRIAQAVDETWLITDQSVGSLVSLASLLKELDIHVAGTESQAEKRQLIVNRYDTRYGMDAEQIAERFGLPLKAVLPECAARMVSAANLGKLLHEVARGDPYVRAVQKLGADLLKSNVDRRNRADNRLPRWMQRWMPSNNNKRGTK